MLSLKYHYILLVYKVDGSVKIFSIYLFLEMNCKSLLKSVCLNINDVMKRYRN